MIGIVVAMNSEAKGVIEKIENIRQFTLGGKQFFSGNLFGKEITLAICGIGKVSASLTTQILIDKFNPSIIVNFGTCGGNEPSVKVRNFYIVDKCCQFDFDLSTIDPVSVGYNQDYDCIHYDLYTSNLNDFEFLSLATADRFSFDQKDIDTISSLGCKLRDMEGGAIAQTCKSSNIPLVSLKGVSDTIGSGEGPEQFYNNLTSVCSLFAEKLEIIIGKL